MPDLLYGPSCALAPPALVPLLEQLVALVRAPQLSAPEPLSPDLVPSEQTEQMQAARRQVVQQVQQQQQQQRALLASVATDPGGAGGRGAGFWVYGGGGRGQGLGFKWERAD